MPVSTEQNTLAGAGPEARELVAQLVSQPDPGAHQTLPRAGHRPQRLGLVAVGHQHPEAMAVGARELGQHEAVKHIALAARHAVSRAHRLDLVGMHRHHRQPSVQQPLDQQTVGPLERHQRHPQTHKPRAQRPDPGLVVTKSAALHDPPPLVDHAHRVLLAGPIHPGEPSLRHDHHAPSNQPID